MRAHAFRRRIDPHGDRSRCAYNGTCNRTAAEHDVDPTAVAERRAWRLGHRFRPPYHGTSRTGLDECAWLGTCHRPREDH